VPPGGDVRATTQECTTLTLGHAAPDAELHPVVESVGKAFGADNAPTQMAFARFWAAPWTNNESGSVVRQAA
jgi:hypothetical protein